MISLLGIKENILPNASLISWVNYLGVIKKGATAARGTMTVVLEEAQPNDYIIPLGTRFIDENGLTFISTQEVVIPIGDTQADVSIECETGGSIGNVPANSIIHLYQNLPYVSEVYNAEPLAGGFDTELDQDTLDRGRQIIRTLYRAISNSDFENIAVDVSGISRAKAIEDVGQVALYLLAADGTPANSQLIEQVIAYLEDKRSQGIALNCYPAVLHPVNITANVRLLPGYSLQTIRLLAQNALQNEFNPLTWIFGRKISIAEIEATLSGVQGIDFVDELILPQENISLLPYELAELGALTINTI